jgi:hypothetical protein
MVIVYDQNMYYVISNRRENFKVHMLWLMLRLKIRQFSYHPEYSEEE